MDVTEYDFFHAQLNTTWAVFDLVTVEICVGNAGSGLVRDAQRTVAP
jgi:hypothetical protein